MMDDVTLRTLVDRLEAGGQIPAVRVDDLKRVWKALPELQAQTTDPSKTEGVVSAGSSPSAVFARIAVLSGLAEKGVPLQEAVFQKVATASLSKDNIEEFLRSFNL